MVSKMENDREIATENSKFLSRKECLSLLWIALRLMLVLLFIKKGTPFFYQGF